MYRGLLHVGTVFCSALLLFLIQPVMGKLLLPWFGGSAGVWATAMLFFQAMLLLGYVYAWLLVRLPSRAQIAIHLTLLAASCLAMPMPRGRVWWAREIRRPLSRSCSCRPSACRTSSWLRPVR